MRQALIADKVDELSRKAKLTPRLRLASKLYNKPDDEIALALSRRFGKEVKAGAVRALEHDLLERLREIAPKK